MSKNILLIEDFPIVQDLYGDFLSNNGFHVEVAEDGGKALDKVKDTEFDFILVDLLLPSVNGLEFLDKFTNRPAKTKVIVLTDFNDIKSKQRANELNIDAYLIKSENTPSQLLEALNQFVKKDAEETEAPPAS